LLPQKECCDFLQDNALKRKIFSFEGELCGIYHESSTEKGTLELELFSLVTRRLNKCNHCGNYHLADDHCIPAVQLGPAGLQSERVKQVKDEGICSGLPAAKKEKLL